MRYWWVNQNQTHRQEITGGYMWSPKRDKNGGYVQFYENMRLTDAGDLVFSYYGQKLQQIGIVQRGAVETKKPAEFGNAGHYWDNDGWLVSVHWHALKEPFRPKDNIDRIRPLLPNKYSPLNRETGDGLQVYLAEVPAELATELIRMSRAEELIQYTSVELHESDAVDDLEDKMEDEISNNTEIDSTEKEQLIKSRRGQGRFRHNLEQIENRCRVTGVSDLRLLRASHIKPWRSCDNNHERLDGNNGFLLAPHIDLLFDRGYMTFENEGSMQVSNHVKPAELAMLGIETSSLPNVGSFTPEQKHYLEYHRTVVFKTEPKFK